MTRKIRIAASVLLSLALAGCGGSRLDTSSSRSGVVMRMASGPISAACNQSGRDAANPRLCGCIQAVANSSLSSGSDQRLAATFYSDPQRAQDVRQSDRASNEAFWKRYKKFAADAERYCAPVA